MSWIIVLFFLVFEMKRYQLIFVQLRQCRYNYKLNLLQLLFPFRPPYRKFFFYYIIFYRMIKNCCKNSATVSMNFLFFQNYFILFQRIKSRFCNDDNSNDVNNSHNTETKICKRPYKHILFNSTNINHQNQKYLICYI